VGIAKAYPLPKTRSEGVVLHLAAGVVDNEIPVTLYSTGKDRELLVGAYCRGKLLDHASVQVRAGTKTDIVLYPATNVGGVYRVTVFEKQAKQADATKPAYKPVAERLLFRKQTARLHVAVRPDKSTYAPGDAVALSFEARNEK